MAGLSIDQISQFLSVSPTTARHIVARNQCHITKVKGGYLRIPLEEFVDILFKNPKYMRAFKHTLETDTIVGRYEISAKIVLDRIHEKEDRLMEQSDHFLTTDSVLQVTGGAIFYHRRHVSEACRTGELPAVKIARDSQNPETWGRWMIPMEGLIVCIATNPDFKREFVNMFQSPENLGKETSFVHKIRKAIMKGVESIDEVGAEKLSYKDVSDILSIPENQVAAMFPMRETFAMKVKREQPYVTMERLAEYLIGEEAVSHSVYERWEKMLMNKDPLEPLLRHALMVREYYVRKNEKGD